MHSASCPGLAKTPSRQVRWWRKIAKGRVAPLALLLSLMPPALSPAQAQAQKQVQEQVQAQASTAPSLADLPFPAGEPGFELDQQEEVLADRVERLEIENLELRAEMNLLRERIALLLGPEGDTRIIRILDGESPVRGPPEAPLTLVEFGDFQSDYTTRAFHVVRRLLEEYPDSLRFIFKHYPITALHPQANEAALAALAAERQQKGWEMHDLLLQNSRRLEPTLYLLLAQQLELDLPLFERDRRSLWALERLSEDDKAAVGAEVVGIPTFFLNGRRLKNWRYGHVKDEIEKLLAEAAWVRAEEPEFGDGPPPPP